MAPRTKRLYGPTELPTAIAALYTVPTGRAALVKSIVVASNGVATTFSLHLNGTGTGKLLLNTIATPAAGSYLFLFPELHLNAGDVLYGVASVGNRAVVTISGFEYI